MKKICTFVLAALMGLALGTAVSCTKDDGGSNGGSNSGSNSGNNSGNNGGNVNDVWVDLGLQSGTKWKNANEVNAADARYDFYTYDKAVATFGDAMPTQEQWRELKDNCQWTWSSGGYTVTGPNGDSIVLPAAGCRNCNGSVNLVGIDGHYWSSTPYGSEGAWILYFNSGSVDMYYSDRCLGYPVRLVQD